MVGNHLTALRFCLLGFMVTNNAIDGKLDSTYISDPSGCTAVTTLVTDDWRILCGNAGDSRAVLSSNGKAVALSYDHKPTNPEELARIKAAGGFVEFNRVNGSLALSRAIGDFEYKLNKTLSAEQQIVTSNPDIEERKLDLAEDEFFVLACDGMSGICLRVTASPIWS
jgi:protein phosphatase 2C family protein 2/3